MASIFKKRILKDRLEQFSIPNMEAKLAIIQKWHQAYKDGHLQKKGEKEAEQEFIQQIFVEVLEHTRFPDSPYSIIPQGKTMTSGQKPDAILGYFENEKEAEKVAAVCEIKDCNTPLDRSQRREGNLSPIQQAFKYKTQYQSCDFVIATNFIEFRLLKDNELNFEKWTLESLADPSNDYFEFKKFYYLLCRKNFIAERGKSVTLKLLSDIQIEQEAITKEFYKLYKELREKLITNIWARNQEAKKKSRFYELAVEKAQKIIDRIVFIAFCEDLGLLPENILQKVIESDSQSYGSTWNTLKGFFSAVDLGSPKLGNADGYNGELFKPDEDLDKLIIDDEICNQFLKIGLYDFSEDLSVNILGHIFEQSISDLEDLKKVSEEKDIAIEGTTSKRKKDGIFYTPEYIVEYIVQNSVGAWLREQEKIILKKHGVKEDIQGKNYEKRYLAAYDEYQTVLQKIKVLDPACGSGAFLVKVFDYLLEENKRIVDILAAARGGAIKFFDTEKTFKEILQKNIYGVDLNPESVEITKLSLWLKTAQRGKKLASLYNNIKCGNSIVEERAYAEKNHFLWGEEFEEIIKDGGFDVVVGNPPYVRQELIKPISPYLEKRYKTYSGKADLYVYFFELAQRVLHEDGYLGFISSGKFLEANYGKNLCKFLSKNLTFKTIINFGDLEVFKGVSAYPIIFIGQKKPPKVNTAFQYRKVDDLNEFYNYSDRKNNEEYLMSDFITCNYKILPKEVAAILKKMRLNASKFNELFPLPTVGIKTGYNEGYLTTQSAPYIFGKNIKRYGTIQHSDEIIFPYKWEGDQYELLKEDDSKVSHLTTHKEKLSKRAVIKEGLKSGKKIWYEFQQINKVLNFDNEFIVYPNVSLGPNFTLSKGAIIDMTAFIIPTNSKLLLGILNSKLFEFFMNWNAITRRGGYNEYKVQYIKEFPIKQAIKPDFAKKIEDKVCEVLEKQKLQSIQIQNFIRLIKIEFQLEKWPRSLSEFWHLEFGVLLQKLKLTNLELTRKDAFLQLWSKYIPDLEELDLESQKIDEEIDEIVFDLYELTADEKQTVLESTR